MKIFKQGQFTVVDLKGGIIINDMYYPLELEGVDHFNIMHGNFITTNRNRGEHPQAVLEAINTIREYAKREIIDE